jgi:CMP-N-acetylneuraminic acid synthetase
MNGIRVTAMIPARLSSKRIPKKNIRFFGDEPLIRYPIEIALSLNRFDSIWVNTDSRELGQVIESYGVKHHMRPPELASDTATNRDFVYEFLLNHECDYVVMINTTSPLLRSETAHAFLDYLEEHQFDTILSVVSEKEEVFFKNVPLNFSLEEKINSQFLEPIEKIVWAMTAWKRSTFIGLQEQGKNPVFGGTIGKFVIPKDEACDLDTEDDWRLAEGILESRSKRNGEKRYFDIEFFCQESYVANQQTKISNNFEV